ncbi:hypothetical protein GEMRC1_012506 [Eukaryota sp. GEM-RC1]
MPSYFTPPTVHSVRSDISDDECHGVLDVLNPRTLAVEDHYFIYQVPFKIGSSVETNAQIVDDVLMRDIHAEITITSSGRLELLALSNSVVHSLGRRFDEEHPCELVDGTIFMLGSTPFRFSIPHESTLPPLLTPQVSNLKSDAVLPSSYSPVAKLVTMEDKLDSRFQNPIRFPSVLLRTTVIFAASRRSSPPPAKMNRYFDNFVGRTKPRAAFFTRTALNDSEFRQAYVQTQSNAQEFVEHVAAKTPLRTILQPIAPIEHISLSIKPIVQKKEPVVPEENACRGSTLAIDTSMEDEGLISSPPDAIPHVYPPSRRGTGTQRKSLGSPSGCSKQIGNLFNFMCCFLGTS